MPVIYRPKRFNLLSSEQQQAKLVKDRDYEIAHLNLTADFQKGKIGEVEFNAKHTQQWQEYENWAIANELYETVSIEQQLAEAEVAMQASLEGVNLLRKELGRKTLRLQ